MGLRISVVIDRSTDADDIAELCDALPGIQKIPAYALAVLLAANGRTLTHDTIREGIFDLTGERCTYQGFRSALSRVSKALRPSGWPVALEHTYGVGYRLRRLDPAWDWRLPPIPKLPKAAD